MLIHVFFVFFKSVLYLWRCQRQYAVVYEYRPVSSQDSP